MRSIPYFPILIATAALALLLFSPIKLRLDAKQRGFSAQLTLTLLLLFGLIRLPQRFILKFDAERAKQNPLELHKSFSFFRLTKGGQKKPLKKRKPNKGKKLKKSNKGKKPENEKLPVSLILKAAALEKLHLKGEIALDDSAFCVFLCGTLNAVTEPLLTLAAHLLPIRTQKARIKAVFLPKFTENSVNLKLEGIVKSNMAKLIKGFLSVLTKKRAKKQPRSGQKSLRTKACQAES